MFSGTLRQPGSVDRATAADIVANLYRPQVGYRVVPRKVAVLQTSIVASGCLRLSTLHCDRRRSHVPNPRARTTLPIPSRQAFVQRPAFFAVPSFPPSDARSIAL